MALIIPHQSNQGIATANGGQAAQYRGEGAFVTPGQENLGRGLQQFAAGVQDLNGVMLKQVVQERQEQLELDLLKDMQAYQSKSAEWESNYTANFKGPNARDAVEQGKAFHGEQLEALRQKYGHNKRALTYIERHCASAADTSVSGLRAYSLKEGEAHKDSVYEGELAVAYTKLSDWRTPSEERQKTEAAMRLTTQLFYGGKGRDATSALAKCDAFIQQSNTAMQQNKLVYLRQTDPAAARRLTQEALAASQAASEVGDAGPAGANAQSAAVNAGQAAASGAGEGAASGAAGGAASGAAGGAAAYAGGLTSEGAELARWLSPQQLAAEHKRNETRLRAKAVERKQTNRVLLEDSKNGLAQAMHTGKTEDFIQLDGIARGLRDMGQEASAVELEKKIELVRFVQPLMVENTWEPLAENKAAVEEAFKERRTPENYALVDGLSKQAVAFKNQQITAFREDPAGYVADHPLLQNQKNGQAVSTAQKVERSRALQEELGAGLGIVPRVTSKNQAEQVNQAYATGDGRAKREILGQLTAEYGEYSLAVMQEAGLKPSVVWASRNLMPSLPKVDMERLLTAGSINWTDISCDQKKAQDTVANSKLVQTLAGMARKVPADGNQQNMVAVMQDDLAKYVAMGGTMQDIEKNLLIVNDSGLSFVLPTSLNLDVKKIEPVLKMVQKEASQEVAKLLAEEHRLPPLERRMATAALGKLYDGGSWVNSKDGFVLLNNEGRAVTLPGGRVVTVAYDELDGKYQDYRKKIAERVAAATPGQHLTEDELAAVPEADLKKYRHNYGNGPVSKKQLASLPK